MAAKKKDSGYAVANIVEGTKLLTKASLIADALKSVLKGQADELELELTSGMLTEFLLNQRMMLSLMLADRLRDAKGKITQPIDPLTPAWGLLVPPMKLDKKNESLEHFKSRFDLPGISGKRPPGVRRSPTDKQAKNKLAEAPMKVGI